MARSLSVLLIWACVWLHGASAMVISVPCAGGNCPFSNIVSAVQGVTLQAGDIVSLASGSYTGACGPGVVIPPGASVIGTAPTTIQCKSAAVYPFYVPPTDDPDSPTASFTSLIFSGTVGAIKGGFNTTLNITDCQFLNIQSAPNVTVIQSTHAYITSISMTGCNCLHACVDVIFGALHVEESVFEQNTCAAALLYAQRLHLHHSTVTTNSWGAGPKVKNLIHGVEFLEVTHTYLSQNSGPRGSLMAVETGFACIEKCQVYGMGQSTLFVAAVLNPLSVMIIDSFFTNCRASAYSFWNGACFYTTGDATITGSTFESGQALKLSKRTDELGGTGGLVYVHGELTAINSMFYNGSAYVGGALYSHGKSHVENCTFQHNWAGSGGAFYAHHETHLYNTTFIDNWATAIDPESGRGGALHASETSRIYYSYFYSNSALYHGGAYYGGGCTDVWNSVFHANMVWGKPGYSAGGAMYMSGRHCNTYITGGVFSYNVAQYTGGALDVRGDAVTVQGALLCDNSAYQGAAVYMGSGYVDLLKDTQLVANTAGYTGSAFSCATGKFLTGDIHYKYHDSSYTYSYYYSSSTVISADNVGGLEYDCGLCGCCTIDEPDVDANHCQLLPYNQCNYTCPRGLNVYHNVSCLPLQGSKPLQLHLSVNQSELCAAVDCMTLDIPTNAFAYPCPTEIVCGCCLGCQEGYEALGNASEAYCREDRLMSYNLTCRTPYVAPPPPPKFEVSNNTVVIVVVVATIVIVLAVGIWAFMRWRRPVVTAEDHRELLDKLSAYENSSGPRSNYGTTLLSENQRTMMRHGSSVSEYRLSVDETIEQVEYADMTIVREIGRGGFGIVFHVRHKQTYTDMALKFFPKMTRSDEIETFTREVNVLANLHHPHCLPFLGIVQHEGAVGILTQLMAGDLGVAKSKFTIPQKIEALLGASRGLAYLHARGITHADLKPHNVLIDSLGAGVLGDFGLSGVNAAIGYTERYAAPEVLIEGGAPNSASDMYSLGCIIVEVLSGEMPYIGTTDISGAMNAGQSPFSAVAMRSVGFTRARLDATTARCLNRDVTTRPSANEITEVLYTASSMP